MKPLQIRKRLGISYRQWALQRNHSYATVRRVILLWHDKSKTKHGHLPSGKTKQILLDLSTDVGAPVSPAVKELLK